MNTVLEEHKINIWAEEKKEKPKESDLKDFDFQNDPFARVFDASCYPVFNHNSERNLVTLRMFERYFTDKLKCQGHLLLTEVYEALGMQPLDDQYRYIGWIYDENNPIGDNFVDFRIMSDVNYNFINGFVNTAILSFNHDGSIRYYLLGF